MNENCHFCGKEAPDKNSALIKLMYSEPYPDSNSKWRKTISSHGGFVGYDEYGRRVEQYFSKYTYVSWILETIVIPRCNSCSLKHKIFNVIWIVSIILCCLSIPGFFAYVIFMPDSSMNLYVGLSILPIGLFVMGLTSLFQYLLINRKINNYAKIKVLKLSKYRFGEKPLDVY